MDRAPRPAYTFERENPIHETRDSHGLLNRLRPPAWLAHNDEMVQRRTADTVCRTAGETRHPLVISIGVGGGGLFGSLWQDATRVGVDVNGAVMRKALADHGEDWYLPVEGDALCLPFRSGVAVFVVADFVLHHLVGQATLEAAVAECMRVLRPGGHFITREPSSYSPSGMALNVVNRFGLMHQLSGASNREFAIAPPALLRVLTRWGTVQAMEGLTFLWSHRLPIAVQDIVHRMEPYLFRGTHGAWLADFVLYVVRRTDDAAPAAVSAEAAQAFAAG